MKRRSEFGWLELIIGIVFVALGILTLARPDWSLSGMVCAYGVAAVVMGIVDILLFIRVEHFTGFGPVLSLIAGILSVMSGIMLIVYPGAGIMVLTVLFPIWFLAHCISRIGHLNRIRFVAGDGIFWFTLIVNIIGLILGCMMLFSPLLTLSAITTCAGVYLILLGVDAIVLAFSRIGRKF